MAVSLEGQSVLLMGASSGIGRATAALFAHEGARVLAAARREDRLRELQAELSRDGKDIETFIADAADAAQCEKAVGRAFEMHGRLDILVYATGTNTPDRSMRRLTREIWDEMIATNLNGAYYCTQAVLPKMREAGRGYLMFVSSISAHVPDVSGAAYQASKRGLIGLAHAVRVEEKEHGIRTCVICPGLVRTEILEKRPMKTPDEVVAKALEPEDVAEAIVAIARMHPRAVVPELELMPTLL